MCVRAGLESLVGPPNPNLVDTMEHEHTAMPDSTMIFRTTNYGIDTRSDIEFYFVSNPDAGFELAKREGFVQASGDSARAPMGARGSQGKGGTRSRGRSRDRDRWWPDQAGPASAGRSPLEDQAKIEFEAKRRDINAQLTLNDCAPLGDPEVWGGRLYTGPVSRLGLSSHTPPTLASCKLARAGRAFAAHSLRSLSWIAPPSPPVTHHACQMFQKYNAVLRGIKSEPESRAERIFKDLTKGNKYTTTLHCINSAIVKLGKLTKAQKVYRGISGGVLPDEFWTPNGFNVCGGVEFAFTSTTTHRDVAMQYASSGQVGMVFEVQMGMVDRGAELEWLSQYPAEKEICFAPLTGSKRPRPRRQTGRPYVAPPAPLSLPCVP